MRYYSCILEATTEMVKEKTTIRLRDYYYDTILGALNNYMYKHLNNALKFFGYREESNEILAAFAYNENKCSHDEACNNIMDMLNEAFVIERMKGEPYEITMQQYLERLLEARRRDYCCNGTRLIDESNLWIYYCQYAEKKTIRYDFSEKIISGNIRKHNDLYDRSFLDELSNIEAHANDSGYTGNIVHYVISSRSIEAARDMTETLMQSLLNAKRISSRRMEIISGIEPELYRNDNHIEETIENNTGGVIVFDLSEKFGHSPTEYKMTCDYILNLVKMYRKRCLFVFTYNMDHPGFSYNILPHLKKYVIPVALREGTGDRKAAVNYMKELIKASEYSEYAHQASEFMKQFPGDSFTQTDVLMAFEQFEAWCLNKNVLQAYAYELCDDYMLDRDENEKSSYDKLNSMIGLTIVKEKINNIIAENIVEKERKKRSGKKYTSGTMHMIFGGNPGSAKTTVAKLFAGIAKEKGILKSGAFVERGGMDLSGFGYVYRIREAFEAAKGGVLFIDEAYSLNSDSAVTVLIQEMENHRDDVITILAGYNERMQNFMKINEGLKSRIPYWIEFPDYNSDELTDIFKLMIKERGFSAEEAAIKEAHYIFEKVVSNDNFGNGRYVRNLMELAVQNQSVRLLSQRKNASDIRKSELFLLKKEDIRALEEDAPNIREKGSAKKELEEMIGLSKVKSILHKAIAGHKLKKLCLERGISKENSSLHMVFTGNPGTAKTTVARLFAEIMKDESILSTGKFVEVGRADLVGKYVGSTAPLVKAKFQEAQGGVLFIDEAYSLTDYNENSYGDEAINTIVQEMENHRDDVIVIFAGYPTPMKHFLERNPGMLSRIAFQVEFEDYTTEELCEITKLMIERKKMKITAPAMEKLRNNYAVAREHNDFGNGRFVRKMLEEAEMNQAERVLQLGNDDITTQLISTIEECDIPEANINKAPEIGKIGFCVS